MKLRTHVALVTIVVLGVSCADADPQTSGNLTHADGPRDVLLRVSHEGGFVAPSYTLLAIPAFTLYGDGTTIAPGPQTEIYPPPAIPAITRQTVDEDGIQAILQAGIDAGLEETPDLVDLGVTMIADATTTVFTFNADGVRRTVRVYALTEITERTAGMSQKEFEARQKLSALVSELGSLADWLPDGSLGPVTPFNGSQARLYVSDYRASQDLPQQPVAWPLDVPLAGFGHPATDGSRCGVVQGTDWSSEVAPEASHANQLTPWVSDGRRFAIAFRPLLPDETGC